MQVVKLGGSLADYPGLTEWLETLSQGPQTTLVVPGGGPFADQVRRAQRRWCFDDPTAHRMALLAMQQYGLMLIGLCSGFRLLGTLTDAEAFASCGGTAIWLPDPWEIEREQIPATWEITSDSLAAWLAGRLGARWLVLVKSAPMSRDGAWSVGELTAKGIVDEGFASFVRQAEFPVLVFNRKQRAAFQHWQNSGSVADTHYLRFFRAGS